MTQIIRFDSGFPTLIDYGNQFWNINEQHSIEFYPNYIMPVLLISADCENLKQHLEEICNDDEPIALDLEWNDYISLFQFCTSKGCLIIRNHQPKENIIIRSFLESHSFYGKGNHNDRQKLAQMFGDTFKIALEDVEQTRLIPNNCSINFIKMSEEFAGKSTAVFKDKEMTFSDWDTETLTMRQVMYAAFDVVALVKCYPNFPAPEFATKEQKVKSKAPKIRGPTIKIDNQFKKQYQIVTPAAIDKSHHLFCYILRNYHGIPNVYTIRQDITTIFGLENDSFINYISIMGDGKLTSVLLTLYTEITQMNLNPTVLNCEEIVQVPSNPLFLPELFTNHDIFFLSSIPTDLCDEELMREFLFAFGVDFDVKFFEDPVYACVYPRDPYSSFRITAFLNHVSSMTITDFPSFIPKLIVKSDKDILTSDFIINLLSLTQEEKEHMTITDETSFITLEFASNAEKETIFERYLSSTELHQDISITPFIASNLYEYLQQYRLIMTNCTLSSKDIFEMFKPYGLLFSIKIDTILKIAYIQFRRRNDAYRALPHITKKADNVRIMQGVAIKIINLPDSITEQDIYNECNHKEDILEINTTDTRFITVVYNDSNKAKIACEMLKRKKINNKQLNVEIQHKKQQDSFIWKLYQVNQWIKVKLTNYKDMATLFMVATKYGKIVDFLVNDEYALIMFPNSQCVENMKSEIDDSLLCDIDTFTFFINKSRLQKTKEIDEDPLIESDNTAKKVFILDPAPELLTDTLIEEKAFQWRRLIYGAHNVDSIAYPGKKRSIFYSRGKKNDNTIKELIISLGESLGDNNKWFSAVYPFPYANKVLQVPPPPMKKARRWVIIDPLPPEMSEEIIRNICAECEPFGILIQNSSIQRGDKRAVIMKEPHAKEVYWKLSDTTFNGKKLNVAKYQSEDAPSPLSD